MGTDLPATAPGFAVATAVVSEGGCSAIESELNRIPLLGAGSRDLLTTSWCAALAAKLRTRPRIAQLLSASHVMGVIPAEAAPALRDVHDDITSLAAPGDAVVMRALVLHASCKSTGHSRRRVLHFLFEPPSLPYGLRWQAQATQS